MNKQLYKLKSGDFVKITFVAILAFLTASCGEEATQGQASTSNDAAPAAESTADSAMETVADEVEAVAEEVEQVAAQVEEAATEAANEAGFLNYDMVMGDPNAPVEIIEYASLTCGHCSTFHMGVLPRIKEKYVDTGKAKIVVRSFLLNGIDAQGSMLSRCVPERRYFAFMNALFGRQAQWYDIAEYQRLSGAHGQETGSQMFIEQTMGELTKMARQVGLNQTKIEACLANEDIQNYVFNVHQEGRDKYKVNSTPTIIVNGNKTNNDYASVERAIEAALD